MYRPRHKHYQNHFQWRPNIGPRMSFDRRNQIENRLPVTHETGEYWCDTCDRSFPALHLLENHKQHHQKCNIDGCQFVAHPKVITKHIQMQHSSGLYKKIAKLDDPEEIKKWREERKKKYPTKENIEKKAAEIKEKIERGEKMGLKHDKNMKNKRTGAGEKRKLPFTQRSQPVFKKKKIPPPTKSIQVNEKRKIKPFAGILHLMMDDNVDPETEHTQCDFLIEDDECDQNQIENSPEINESSVCGALSSLICNYASSDEDSDKDKKISNLQSNTSERSLDDRKCLQKIDAEKIMKECDKNDIKSDNDSGPEEAAIMKKHNDNTEVPIVNYKGARNIKKIKEDNKGRKAIIKKHKPKLPSTLLEKLLFREMQQERNMVLQCVRYIVKNNYFDK